MSDKATSQQSESYNSDDDNRVDTIAAVAIISLFVVTLLFWISNH